MGTYQFEGIEGESHTVEADNCELAVRYTYPEHEMEGPFVLKRDSMNLGWEENHGTVGTPLSEAEISAGPWGMRLRIGTGSRLLIVSRA